MNKTSYENYNFWSILHMYIYSSEKFYRSIFSWSYNTVAKYSTVVNSKLLNCWNQVRVKILFQLDFFKDLLKRCVASYHLKGELLPIFLQKGRISLESKSLGSSVGYHFNIFGIIQSSMRFCLLGITPSLESIIQFTISCFLGIVICQVKWIRHDYIFW